MRHPRIQSLTVTAGSAFGVLALVAAGGMIWLSAEQRSASEVIERHARSLEIIDELEVTLLARSRAASVALATGDPARIRTVAALDVETERLLRQASELVQGDDTEARLVGALRDARTRYLQRRRGLEELGVPLNAVVTDVREDFDLVMDLLATLRSHSEMDVLAARAYGAELEEAAWLLGVAVGALVLFGIAGLLFAVRKHVIGPLLSLRDTVSRWRAGEPRQAVPERGPREIVEIERAFNHMSAQLARQRDAQLTFLAGVAHDLRNPLNGLAMAAAAMRDIMGENGDPAKQRVVSMVERQVRSLDRMLGDLLDITRIEAGQLNLEPRRLDLRSAVAEVAELYAPTALDHPIRLCLPNGPVLVRADPLRVEQVVANLVSNAIKYSPSGAPVRVELRCEGDEAWIEVEDQGAGIPEEDLGSIFEPFRRRFASKDAAPGAGLGLSIVRRVVHAHDGEIEVFSSPGKGALFRVRLPLARCEEGGEETASEPAATLAPPPLTPQPS